MVTTHRAKEENVCAMVDSYVRQGFKKSEAVRKVMVDFQYATEAAIYGILRRCKERNNNDQRQA